MLRFLNVTATATKFTNSWNWKIWLAGRRHLLGPFVLFSVAYGRLEVMLFVSGALVAQLDLVVGIHDAPTSALTEEALPGYDLSKELPRKKNHQSRAAWVAVLIVGLYLGSTPDYYIRATPGYVTLARLIPASYGWNSNRIWPSIGAVMVVWSVLRLKEL